MQNHLTVILIIILGMVAWLVVSVHQEKDEHLLQRIAALEKRTLPSIQIERASVWAGHSMIEVEDRE